MAVSAVVQKLQEGMAWCARRPRAICVHQSHEENTWELLNYDRSACTIVWTRRQLGITPKGIACGTSGCGPTHGPKRTKKSGAAWSLTIWGMGKKIDWLLAGVPSLMTAKSVVDNPVKRRPKRGLMLLDVLFRTGIC